MREDRINQILSADAVGMQKLLDYAEREYGLDASDPEQLLAYAQAHPETALPNIYLDFGNSRNIYINHHSPIYNGIAHNHAFFELIFVAKGSVEDNIEGVTVTLPEGGICVHNPLAKHCITKCGPDDFLINILISTKLFETEVFAPIYKDQRLCDFFTRYLTADDNNPNYMAFPETTLEVTAIVEMMVSEFYREDCSEPLICAQLLLLFGNLLRNQETSSLQGQLVDYLMDHLAEATLKETADYFMYHEKYFSTLVRRETGRSFHQLLTELRIRKSVSLLLNTDLSIEKVAVQVGYLDPSSFYTNFKKRYGKTPSQFRKKR